MAMKTATRMSTLNPNAPLFIPASYHAAEDFSPEWWHLVQTCPAFRDFWLRERFDDSMVDAASLLDANDEFEAIDDLLDMQDVHMDGLKEFEVECALDNDISDNYEKDIHYALDDLNLNELQAQRIWREPLKHHDKISNKSPRKQLRGGNQYRIHQPRA